MVFQTYVDALVPREAIAGFALTHFQFTNRGKPIVFHEDHGDYVGTLDRFFFRKVSPEAARLRAACLELAAAPDDAADLGRIGRRHDDYRLKAAAQTNYPAPGQLFYRDQFCDMTAPVLARATGPYVVLVGPPALTGPLAAGLTDEGFRLHRVRRGLRRRRGRSRAGPRQLPRAAPRRRGDPRHASRRSGWCGCAPAARGCR